MSQAEVVTRAQVPLGSIDLEGFRLPDGSYRMSQSQAAQLVGKQARGIFDFLKSKTFKRLQGEALGGFDFLPQAEAEAVYRPDEFVVEIGPEGSQGQTRIRGVHLEVVALYWQWECYRGNKQAFALMVALVAESLERRFDTAFGVERSDADRDEQMSQRMGQLQQSLEKLGEAYAEEDVIRHERDQFYQLLLEQGIDPYAVPAPKAEGRMEKEE